MRHSFYAAFAAVALVSGVSCVSAPPPAPAEREAAQRVISIQAFAGDESSGLANSYVISGTVDAVVVDAQSDGREALRLARQIQASRKVLRTIFITHAHPDHFRGMETLLKVFPGSIALSSRSVSEELRKSGADRRVVPQPVAPSERGPELELEIEHERVRVIELGEPGESASAAMLYLPSSRTLICGDVVFNGVHPRIAGSGPEGWPESWMDTLEEFKRIVARNRVERILPGHGPAGDARLIDESRRYLESFLAATLPPATPAEAVARMKAWYPEYRLEANLKESVRRWFAGRSAQGH